MKKNFLQTLLVVVLSVIGVSQCWAAYTISPFTFVEYNSGTCGLESNPSINYNNLNGTCYGTINTYVSDDDGYVCRIDFQNAPANSKNGVMNLFSYTHSVEPYTKVVLTYNYELLGYTNYGYQSSTLYKFDDETIAKTTALYFDNGTPTTGEKYRFDYLCTTSGWNDVSGNTTFVFDNLAGSSTKSISKYIMLVLCEAHLSAAVNKTNAAVFRCTKSDFTTTYGKVITFDKNGGDGGSMSNQNIDNKGNLTTNAFTRTDYTFTGWNTQADGKGTAYADGAEITATASDKGAITLYAQWKEKSYYPFSHVGLQHGACVYSDNNSISYERLNNSISGIYSYKNPVYSYDGFQIYQNFTGGTKSCFHALFKYDCPVESYTKVVLTYSYLLSCYTNWSFEVASLYQFDNENTAKTTELDFTDELTNNAGSTYRFDFVKNQTLGGWKDKSGSTDFVFDNLTGTSKQSYTKYIMLVLVEGQGGQDQNPGDYIATLACTGYSYAYTYRKVITFDKNGGSGSMSNQNIDNKGNLTTNAFTRTGYTFNGWNTQADGKGTTYANGAEITATTGSKGPVTLYAQWTPIVYNITYKVNGGSEITEHKTYTIETATFALPKPTKNGYTFDGWFTDKDCTVGYTTEIAQGSIGDKTFYAKWSENVVSDGTNKTLTEAQNEVNTALETWVAECEGSKAINLTINRTIYKDGYYNTLCLPFAMSADQITETFGAYKELKQFQSATVQGIGSSRSIVIEVENATEIEAGKAYLISFEKGTDITTLTFNNVVVSTTAAPEEPGTLAYQGILAPFQLPYGNQNYLFLGEKNALYWPIDDGTFMKGFRAYFRVNTNPASAPYRVGMRAAFGGRQTPTDLSPAVSGQEVRKLLEQGRVVIVNKGVKYNMNGATVQ